MNGNTMTEARFARIDRHVAVGSWQHRGVAAAYTVMIDVFEEKVQRNR